MGEQRPINQPGGVSEQQTESSRFDGRTSSTTIPSVYMTPSRPIYLPAPAPPPHMLPPYNVFMPNTHPEHHVRSNGTTVGTEGHSMMVDFIHQINQRMIEIKVSVAKLNDIQKDMNQIHIHFNRLEKDNFDIKTKMNTFETFAETVGTVCDDFLNTKQAVTDEISDLNEKTND